MHYFFSLFRSFYELFFKDLSVNFRIERNLGIAADNNGHNRYLYEIAQLQQTVLPENVEIYVLLDRSGNEEYFDDYDFNFENWSGTKFCKLQYIPNSADPASQGWLDWGELDSSSVDTLKRFIDTFPNLQIIVSTHSPLVLTGLETKNGENIVQRMVAKTEAPEILHDVYGIDCNLMLEENMDVPKRNAQVQELFDKAWESISEKRIEDAKINVENLERITPADQPELVRLRSLIKRLEILGK